MSERRDRGGGDATARASREDDLVRAKRLGDSGGRTPPRKAAESTRKQRKKRSADEVESGKQVVRLLNILRTLEGARHGLTVRELMDQVELGCGIRQVYRGLDHLVSAGFPLVKEGTRWRIDGETLRMDPLQPSQALALLAVEGLLQPLSGHEVVDVIQGLRTTVRARLKPEGRAWVDQFRHTLAVTAQAPIHGAAPGILEMVGEACIEEQCLHILYEAPGKPPEERTVEPHLVWSAAGRAYLVAYCRKATGFRTFAVQRIRRAHLLDECFERRAELDEEEYVQRGFGVMHGAVHEITVHFTPSVAHLARERAWHASQELTELPDGSCDLHMRAAGLPEIAAWVASFGGKVRPVRPPELVSAVRELHREGLEAVARSDP